MKTLLLALVALSSLNAVAAPTAPAPLAEPKVSVIYVPQVGDTDAPCHTRTAQLYTTSLSSTRDRVFQEINADDKLKSMVEAAKTAAKDAEVKALVHAIETKRPATSAKIIFTVAKYDSEAITHYGMRISYTGGGDPMDSIPAYYVACINRYGDQRVYRDPYSNTVLNYIDLNADNEMDAFGAYQVIAADDVASHEKVIAALNAILNRIPLIDTELSLTAE